MKVGKQMPVNKLAAVIGIKAQDRERQCRFYLCETCEHLWLGAIPYCAALGPLRVHVGGGYCPAKLSRHRLAAMRYRVRLDVTRNTDIPVLGANRNLAAQQRTRTRPAPAAAA